MSDYSTGAQGIDKFRSTSRSSSSALSVLRYAALIALIVVGIALVAIVIPMGGVTWLLRHAGISPEKAEIGAFILWMPVLSMEWLVILFLLDGGPPYPRRWVVAAWVAVGWFSGAWFYRQLARYSEDNPDCLAFKKRLHCLVLRNPRAPTWLKARLVRATIPVT